MTTQGEYKVIHNPTNFYNKWELWYRGEMSVQNANGFLEKKVGVKKLKAYSTETLAEGAKTYAEQLKQFRGDL